MKTIYLIGYGKIAQQLADRLKSDEIIALGRQHKPTHEKTHYIVANLDAPILPLSKPKKEAIIFYFVPPAHARTDLRMMHFLNAINQNIIPEKFIYISTTAVYKSSKKNWINESTPPEPKNIRGKKRLQSETQIDHWGKINGTKVFKLRVGGIYGVNRLPKNRILQNEPVLSPDQCGQTNLIHENDLLTICEKLVTYEGRHRLFNVCDGHPTTLTDYFNAVADILKYKRPKVLPLEEIKKAISPTLLEFFTTSRKIENNLLRKELPFVWTGPDYKSGLETILEQRQNNE